MPEQGRGEEYLLAPRSSFLFLRNPSPLVKLSLCFPWRVSVRRAHCTTKAGSFATSHGVISTPQTGEFKGVHDTRSTGFKTSPDQHVGFEWARNASVGPRTGSPVNTRMTVSHPSVPIIVDSPTRPAWRFDVKLLRLAPVKIWNQTRITVIFRA